MPSKRIERRGKRENGLKSEKRIGKRGERNKTEKKVDIRTQMMWQIKLRIMYV